MKIVLQKASLFWKDTSFVLGFIQASCLLAFALIVNFYAVRYATTNAGPPVPDIILSFFNKVDTSFIDYQLALYIQYGFFILIVVYPRYALLFMRSLSILILVRSFFINLTNLGIPEGVVPTVSFFTQGGDLFFSGHTALPFLAALVFWDMKFVRYLGFALSIFMGISVLLGHYHYSIDVFAAPFITYGVFKFTEKFFNKNVIPCHYDSQSTA